MVVELRKTGNWLVVASTNDDIRSLAAKTLTFKVTRMLFGMEARKTGRKFEIETVTEFVINNDMHVACHAGFYRRLGDAFKRAGYVVKYSNTQPTNPNLRVDMSRIAAAGLTFRGTQQAVVDKMLAYIRKGVPARYTCPTGYGKTFLIKALGLALPDARIDITTKRVAVLRDRILPDLAATFGSVSMVGGGRKDRLPGRIRLYTFDSLDHSDGQADVLIVDEAHEVTERVAGFLGRYSNSANLGMSASNDKRTNRDNFYAESILGPVVEDISYESAVEMGTVAPLVVRWTDVDMDANPVEGEENTVARMRYGVWRNRARNAIIAQDARLDADDSQTLITVTTVEHALALAKHLPEYAVVYSGEIDGAHVARFVREGLITSPRSLITPEQRQRMTADFEAGRLKKAICTTVWDVGVSFNQLATLIRADAGASAIGDDQKPGRAARLHNGKKYGLIRDYTDGFDEGFERRASKRRRNYEKHGWLQLTRDEPLPEDF